MDLIARYLDVSPEPRIWLIQLLAILVVTALVDLGLSRVLEAAARSRRVEHSTWNDALLHAARLPLRLTVWLVGLSVALQLAASIRPGHWVTLMPHLLRAALIGIGALLALRFIGRAQADFTDPKRNKKPMDATTARSLAKLAQLIVVLLAALMLLETLGFSISGVMAMGGVGGIAIGFAAKDLLSNFFGGIMIYWDKPFREGDWIRSPDRQIEGVVQEIGWRLTRIQTFQNRPLYVPNAVFASIAVENPSRMTNWQITTQLGLSYDDSERIAPVCDEVRAMLKAHPGIDTTQSLVVRFDAFAASSLNLLLDCYTKTTDWNEYLRVQEDVFLQIIAIVTRHGASFAFPTQTLYTPDLAGRPDNAAPPSAPVAG